MTCRCEATDRHFGDKRAQSDLSRYKKRGPDSTSAALLRLLQTEELSAATLLDIGCGIGALSFDLLKDEVDSATLVDASASYLKLVDQEAERRGLRERVAIVYGDAVENAELVPDADLVTLDRVVCCYPEFERLIEISALKARSWYALSIPRDRWFVRLSIRFQNWIRSLRADPFRAFVHDPDRIHELLVQAGFTQCGREQNAFWQMSVYRRN